MVGYDSVFSGGLCFLFFVVVSKLMQVRGGYLHGSLLWCFWVVFRGWFLGVIGCFMLFCGGYCLGLV